jgi:hypothetical protein
MEFILLGEGIILKKILNFVIHLGVMSSHAKARRIPITQKARGARAAFLSLSFG